MDEATASLEAVPTLYIAEGDAPGTRTPCRVITDSPVLAATAISAILERMPLREPTTLPITCFLTKKGDDFAGFDVKQGDDDELYASVVLTGNSATPERLLTGINKAAQALTE